MVPCGLTGFGKPRFICSGNFRSPLKTYICLHRRSYFAKLSHTEDGARLSSSLPS